MNLDNVELTGTSIRTPLDSPVSNWDVQWLSKLHEGMEDAGWSVSSLSSGASVSASNMTVYLAGGVTTMTLPDSTDFIIRIIIKDRDESAVDFLTPEGVNVDRPHINTYNGECYCVVRGDGDFYVFDEDRALNLDDVAGYGNTLPLQSQDFHVAYDSGDTGVDATSLKILESLDLKVNTIFLDNYFVIDDYLRAMPLPSSSDDPQYVNLAADGIHIYKAGLGNNLIRGTIDRIEVSSGKLSSTADSTSDVRGLVKLKDAESLLSSTHEIVFTGVANDGAYLVHDLNNSLVEVAVLDADKNQVTPSIVDTSDSSKVFIQIGETVATYTVVIHGRDNGNT